MVTNAASPVTRTEIYVRFETRQGAGISEAPFDTIEAAARQFVDDHDSVSATRLSIDVTGAIVTAENVTRDVMAHLSDLIEDAAFETAPHPRLQDAFDRWEVDMRRQVEEDRDHEDTERAMLGM